jgi:hypothetical protein
MSNRKIFLALISAWMVTFASILYYAYMQVREDKIVDVTCIQIISSGCQLAGNPVRVSDRVRKDFNILESSFVAIKWQRDPF